MLLINRGGQHAVSSVESVMPEAKATREKSLAKPETPGYFLRELMSVMPAAVYACDRKGVVTYYNPRAVEIWGRTPELDDSTWSFLDSLQMYRTDGTPLTREEAPVRKVLATGMPVINGEFVVERSDLSRINVLANITPLRDSAGIVSGAVSIFQDVTELKLVQQEREELLHELERSNRELSQFSYTVSHDLRAPVNHVRALTQLLVRRGHSTQKNSSHLLTLIERAADRMERLIESLLRYAQAGQGQLKPERVAVNPIIESLRLTLAPLITKTHAQIVCGPLPVVEADPVLLEQLFQNLIVNAIQYHRPGEAPVVEISGERLGDEWQFTVKDNGEGIPPNYHDGIFEPLKRLHGDESMGSGLGLALCRTIVARHGGRIWVESKGAGCGSVFCFTLADASHSSTSSRTMTVDAPG
jgi:signal transduction histidine kinase